MIRRLLQYSLSPEALSAFQMQEQLWKSSPGLPSQALEISQDAAHTLLLWGLPRTTAMAILLAPLLKYDVTTAQVLAMTFDQKSIELASWLVNWNTASETLVEPSSDTSSVQYSLQLRRLLRQIYLDLPDASHILLILAEQDVRFSLNPEGFIEQMKAVFVPLAGILGMWHLRRQWVDKCLSLLHPREYKEFTAVIEKIGPDTHEDMKDFLNKNDLLENLSGTAEDKKKLHKAIKIACERGKAYQSLKNRLFKLFQDKEYVPIPEMELMSNKEEYVLRLNEDEQKDELAYKFKVRIKCGSIDDCYRVLGSIHSLGKPVISRDADPFTDFIASPMPNGYQALHTTIIYQFNGASGEHVRKCEITFRILTHQMHDINELGILCTFHNSPSLSHKIKAWWSTYEEYSDRFHKRKSLLQQELGTCSHMIYVFTPQGEVYQLTEGSTALDFAYSIHKELGNHAAKIEVNSKLVSYNYPLRNGDLVHVRHIPHFGGPDWSWLSSVSSSQAKHMIRRELISRAHEIHPGRSKIEDTLMKFVQYYKQKKHYDLTINTVQLEAFLLHTAQVLGLPDLEALYIEVDGGNLDPQKLISRLVSKELAAMIVVANGDMVSYSLNQIFLCDSCRPIPGEPILAIEYLSGTKKRLTVHCQTNQVCLKGARSRKSIPVRWAEQASIGNTNLILFQIGVEDRYGILGDILNLLYSEPRAYLRSSEARPYIDGSGDITLAVEASSLDVLADFLAHLNSLQGVRTGFSFLPSPSQSLALKPLSKPFQLNPYTYQEVYDRLMFYDREPYITTILNWLKEPLPTKQLILHGQRRVGKTSLAKYLIHEILPQQRLAQAVWIDFQDFSAFSAQSIANIFVQSVYETLKKSMPEQQTWEEPLLWLNRALEEAVKQLRNQRLLIILDEFNVLLDMERYKRLDPIVFSHLRSILNKRRDLNWLLLVQDTHFRDSEQFASAGILFQQSLDLHLSHLDPKWAHKLITEPADRSGIHYEDPIPMRILDLTDGNPFLIQVICYELLKQVMLHEQTKVTIDDFDHVVNLITSMTDGPRIFHHFVNYLSDIQKIVLIEVAHSSTDRNWINVSSIISNLQRKEKKLHREAIVNALQLLEGKGVLALRNDDHLEQVCIPIKLFQKYIEDCMDLKCTIEEWQATHTIHIRS